MPLRNIVIIGLMAIVSLACYSVASKNRFANLFAEALDVVNKEALYEEPRGQLFDSAMQGMLTGLDEHSNYISGKNYTAFDQDIQQKFGGVGMYVDVHPETEVLKVTAAMPDTPAFRAGLLPGDSILEIEGKSTTGLARGEAVENMRGPAGEAVTLTIENADGKRDVTLVREIIPLASVHGDVRNLDGSWNYELMENKRIGYVRLIQFGARTVDELRAGLEKVNGKVDGLIIDLRNNRGGLLTAAVSICDMFLPENLLIVQTRGREDKVLDEYFAGPDVAVSAALPVVVLINRESASASEIVAACLQDHGRATLIGEGSWGKGTVQNVIPIQRGTSALKLTTSSYWPPNGKNFDRSPKLNTTPGKHGVWPTDEMIVEMTEEEVFENYLKRHERDLRKLINRGKPTSNSKPELRVENAADSDAVPDASEGKESAPHVDRPMQKAIEFLEKAMQVKVAA